MGVGAALMGQAVQEVQMESQSWYAKASAVVEDRRASVYECLFAMRTVVAFGGEHKELQRFQGALVQARRGGVRNGFKIGAGMGYTMTLGFPRDMAVDCGGPLKCVVFLGYALAFYVGMLLRYNDEKNPATGELWQPGTILAIFFCIFIGSFMIGIRAFRRRPSLKGGKQMNMLRATERGATVQEIELKQEDQLPTKKPELNMDLGRAKELGIGVPFISVEFHHGFNHKSTAETHRFHSMGRASDLSSDAGVTAPPSSHWSNGGRSDEGKREAAWVKPPAGCPPQMVAPDETSGAAVPASSQSAVKGRPERYFAKSTSKASAIVPVNPDPSFASSPSRSEVEHIQLCSPTLFYTFAASALGAIFIFLGLSILSLSESHVAEGPETPEVFWVLSGRWAAWTCFYHLPIFTMAILNIRAFCIYGSAPTCLMQNLNFLQKRAEEDGWKRPRLIGLFVILMQGANLLVYGMLFFAYVGKKKQHLGLILIHGIGHLLCMIMTETWARWFLPTPLAEKYSKRMGPSTLGTALLGFLAVIVGYTMAFRFAGPWIGVFLPSLLSLYELGSTAILVRTFTKEFVQQREVRQIYSMAGANQGILVSSHICMLHAMAEGARMILILAPITHNEADYKACLTPIVSGFLWNVMVRAGVLERFLFVASCQWKTCSRCNLLLQKVKYSTGLPRFFVIAAIAAVRGCFREVLPAGQERLGYAILCLLVADLLENLVSWILKSCGWQVYPEWRPLSLEQLKSRAAAQLHRRAASIDFDAVSSGGVAAVSENTKGFREECWKLRARFDFLYGKEDWGILPFWAHVVPVFIAQFHTLLCIIFLCNGLHYVLGFCQGSYDGIGRALMWWPSMTEEICG
eukprot:s2734_g3.t4